MQSTFDTLISTVHKNEADVDFNLLEFWISKLVYVYVTPVGRNYTYLDN